MAKTNLRLYEFLKDRETHICWEGINAVKVWVIIYFYDLEEFTDIIKHHLDDGGIDINLNNGYVAVELNDIIEGEGNDISDYKNIFNEYEYAKAYGLL